MRIPSIVLLVSICGGCAGTTAIAPATADQRAQIEPTPLQVRAQTISGSEHTRLSSALIPARERLRQCLPGSNGKVNVLVTQRENSIHLGFEPGESLDPTAKDCMLEALSTVDLEETGTNVGGTSYTPTGYTSIIQISW